MLEGKETDMSGIKEMSWLTQIRAHMDSIDDWLSEKADLQKELRKREAD